MNNKQVSTPGIELVDQELIASLLDELHNCFSYFQDGIVDDNTFVGGLPLSYLNADGSLEALTIDESRQIRRALTESPPRPKGAFDFSLSSLFNWIPFLSGSGDKQSRDRDDRPSPAIIGSDGQILPLPKDINLNALIETKLGEQGLPHFSAYWYAIKEKLDAKKLEERHGDLSLIDSDRKKFAAKRLNATPFEQVAQKFSARISLHFCDANGDIVSVDALEQFINQLVDCLLDRTKPYWPIAPLLSIFDAIVVPVLRPLLYPHITWTSDHNFFSEGGVFDVRQLANKRTSCETTPTWNCSAQQQSLHCVEEALKRHLSLKFFGFRLFDAFSTYNREIHSSVHMDQSIFSGITKTFGSPVHAQDVIQLIQPIPQKPEESLVDRVMTYRSAEEGVWH